MKAITSKTQVRVPRETRNRPFLLHAFVPRDYDHIANEENIIVRIEAYGLFYEHRLHTQLSSCTKRCPEVSM